MLLKIKNSLAYEKVKGRQNYNLPYDSLYGRIKGRLGEPCLNFKSRLLTSFCRLAQFSPRRKFTELPFADEKFELVFQRRSRRRPRPRNPYFTTPVLSSAGAFIAFSCRRVLRSSLIFMQRLHDRTRISPEKRFPSSLFPPTRHWLVLTRRQLSCSNSVEI